MLNNDKEDDFNSLNKELEKLNLLKAKGIISDEEFNTIKMNLINKNISKK